MQAITVRKGYKVKNPSNKARSETYRTTLHNGSSEKILSLVAQIAVFRQHLIRSRDSATGLSE